MKTRQGWRVLKAKGAKTYDCAFLEPEALPPDLPPPVILKDVWFGGVVFKKVSR